MKLIVAKSQLDGQVSIPASKSHTIRAVAIAALAKGQSTIINPLTSTDSLAAVRAYSALGAKIDTSDPDKWVITGNGGKVTAPGETIDVGNSGTTMNLALGSAALTSSDQVINLTGDHQIQTRPVQPLLDALNQLGANCRTVNDNGNPPVQVIGKLKGGKVTVWCSSSQYLSSLLIATPLAENDTEIEVALLHEAGYVDITLDWLRKQNIKFENQDMKKFLIEGGQSYTAFELAIPADFSSATFFICAAAIAGRQIEITNLDLNDSQPDKAVIDYLKKMGADIEATADSVIIRESELRGAEIDLNDSPDALPAMAVTAIFAQGTTKLVNVPQAREKETDRIDCMAQELAKLGIKTEQLPDGLIIHSGVPKPALLDSHHDHRIVMALAIAGLTMEEPIEIENAEAMNVTFPNFVALMNQLGGDMKLQ